MKQKNLTFLFIVFILFFLIGSREVYAQAVLKTGMSDATVSVIQTKLKTFGYYFGEVDGAFGSATRQAVLNFQMDCDLVPDGVVGTDTFQALQNFSGNPSRSSVSRLSYQIVSFAKQFYGVQYVWAGASPDGFDCSGFIYYVFQKNGIAMPRMADGQFEMGVHINRYDLQPGDLVFFSTYEPGPSHVGVYIGEGNFIHASSGAGEVTITSLDKPYYQSRYLGARRIIR